MYKILEVIRTIGILLILWLVYNREPVVRYTTEYVLLNNLNEIPSGKLVRMGFTITDND
jgi:hypothetical protein